MTEITGWPEIPYERWKPTGASLHMWLQIVGKFRLANTPWVNHSWHATLYVTPRGLTTGPVPGPTPGLRADYTIDFDFLDHTLRLSSSSGPTESLPLEPMSVAEFHRRFVDRLALIGAPTGFHGSPNEVPDATPFPQQTASGDYDPQAAHDFWQVLRSAHRVFSHFRTGFLGKSSPVHLFWGSLDLAVTRFSGRPAPLHPGGIPNLPDDVTREAYSHEVHSAGFWAGGGGVDEAAFYAYAYPTPDGFKDEALGVEDAYWHEGLGEFVLPYDAVRRAADPEAKLMAFLQASYEAAAKTGDWNRKALECDLGTIGKPRDVAALR